MRFQTKESLKGDYWKNEEYYEILADQIGEMAIEYNEPINWTSGISI